MEFNARIIIYPKDVQILTGKSYRQSLRLFKKAKAYFGKSKHDLLSYEEFCTCYNLPTNNQMDTNEHETRAIHSFANSNL